MGGEPGSRSWALFGLLVATPLLAGACTGQTPRGSSAVTTVPSATASVVDVRSVAGYGKILVTKSGQSLYLFTADTPMRSNCTGYCAQTWPPLVLKGALHAGPGADPKLLSTGGHSQVFYAKHALYTYVYDTQAGMTTGEGVKTYGGTWLLVSPSGQAVTSTSH